MNRFSDFSAPSQVTLVTLGDDHLEVTEKLKVASIPFREDATSNISGTTITQVVIPIAAIVVPVFVQIILELRKSSSQTLVRIGSLTINILDEENIEKTLKSAITDAVNQRGRYQRRKSASSNLPKRTSSNPEKRIDRSNREKRTR